MTETYMRYPGDPVTRVQLLTGAEFRAANPDRSVTVVSGDTVEIFPVEEVICDVCNVEILPGDDCAVAAARLYCPRCMDEYVRPYLIATAD